mgnify:CR=1 FL=1
MRARAEAVSEHPYQADWQAAARHVRQPLSQQKDVGRTGGTERRHLSERPTRGQGTVLEKEVNREFKCVQNGFRAPKFWSLRPKISRIHACLRLNRTIEDIRA